MWSMPDDAVTSETQKFTVGVTRLGCAGGVTGNVLDPEVSFSASSILVKFEVEANKQNLQLCPGNDTVAFDVDLGEPIGERQLIDGSCAAAQHPTPAEVCLNDGVRWSPPPPPVICHGPSLSEGELARSSIPTPPTSPLEGDREAFRTEVLEGLAPLVVGADAGPVVALLRAAGWTVTVVERSATTSTATPDQLWNRLIVTTCDGRVDTITFG